MARNDCDAHGWNFAPEDTCPVCDGIAAERERIVALLAREAEGFDECYNHEYARFTRGLIALIEAEDEKPTYSLPWELQEALDRITIRKKP